MNLVGQRDSPIDLGYCGQRVQFSMPAIVAVCSLLQRALGLGNCAPWATVGSPLQIASLLSDYYLISVYGTAQERVLHEGSE